MWQEGFREATQGTAVALKAESTEHAGESAVKDRPRLDK